MISKLNQQKASSRLSVSFLSAPATSSMDTRFDMWLSKSSSPTNENSVQQVQPM